MRYPESVEFLYALGNEIRSAKFGLDGIRALLEDLNSPQRSFRSIHVAGTNGKGSTCALIEAALRAAGYRTGFYSSPHLVEPTERIQIAGAPVTRDQFSAAFAEVHAAVERLMARGVLEHHSSYFETVTAMGFLLFCNAGVEIAVVEVGLGGRLDATNAIAPEVCAITQIDFDHERFLGNSLAAIAGEKAGILKRGVPAVFSRQRPEATKVLEAHAAELGIHVVRTSELQLDRLHLDERGSEMLVDGRHVRCPLAGRHQVENALTACGVLRLLGVAPEFAEAHWPGRLERIQSKPDIFLDGAHNPAGARALAAYISEFHAGREIWIVYGAMRDKAVQEVAEILFPLAARVVLTAPAQARALRPEALLETIEHPNAIVAVGAAAALEEARRAPATAAVFITGSLYLAGEVRKMVC